MNRDTLKQIMIDQKDIYLNNPLITRQYFLEANVNYCFVGIRRTGKSYMMYQQIKQLEADGIPLSQIIYVNFEDERLLEMTAEDLNLILEIGLEISETDIKPHLFLDEIQNINGWEKFVRRIADMKYRINITGSNSKMLSSEIASTLGGRFVIMNIYPYSFSEYLIANNMTKNYLDVISTKDRADVQNQYNKYVTYGAFPELVEIRNKRAFLNSIYQTVYLGDIITRNKITNDFAIRLILKKIAESVTKPLSYNRLTNILKSSGMSIGKQTVINYVSYMTDSYLLFTLQNYAAKHKAAGNGFGYGIAPLDGVSRTISARYYKDGSEILIAQEGKNPRRLTPRECARLQGFPDSFKIPVSDTQAYKQFGNSVVVPLMADVAKLVVGKLEVLDEAAAYTKTAARTEYREMVV